ncbi:MAG: Formate dehydrogenase, nitrate-inducible, iron-sulfur subunit [Phycisphaerae bacterium]|nr:Formate dehydrogenase, nitrate-inducible, iron-sulfur subunit [Phycisphaerae bacterium]
MSCSRRDVLRSAGVGLVTLTISGHSALASGPAADPGKVNGVLVDITKCIGCRRCEFACQESAGFEVPPIESFEDKSVMTEPRRPSPGSYTIINQYSNPRDPALPVYAKFNCLHCNDPACMSACLVHAFTKQADGAVIYDPWKCMGCRYCMVACPFQIPTYDYENPLTPQVRKCNLCAHRVPNELPVPACVKICPADVMTYGPRHELIQLAHDNIARYPDRYVDQVYGEHEVGGTSWLYIAGQPFDQIGFLNLPPEAPPRLTETIQHGVFKKFVPPLAWFGLLGAIMHLARPATAKESTPGNQP